jgi:hypothetical protein
LVYSADAIALIAELSKPPLKDVPTATSDRNLNLMASLNKSLNSRTNSSSGSGISVLMFSL